MARIRRRTVVAGLLLAIGILAVFILAQVLATVFFAITVAYVLYPLRTYLVDHEIDRRLAAVACTTLAFVVALALAAPAVYVLYLQRGVLLSVFTELPRTVTVTAFEVSYTVEVVDLVARLRSATVALAVSLAGAAPVIALKAFLFTFVVYALLLRPEKAPRAILEVIPGNYHDVVYALHRRIKHTLYAIYVLQAATAFGTFLIAYVMFALLGFSQAFALAVVAGVLQFVPIVGPSIVIVAVAAAEAIAGNVTSAAVVLIVGLVFVGFLPDALIRPRLASLTASMPASIYFVGFTGGVLSLGVIGFIAGPLVVALLIEAVQLVTNERATRQIALGEDHGRA